MNDTEVINEVRARFGEVHMTMSLDTVVARGRTLRRRKKNLRRAAVAVAAAAAALAAVKIWPPAARRPPWQRGPSARNRPASWRSKSMN
jgi:hypothetical protein